MSDYTKGPWLLEKNEINGNIDIVSNDRYFVISTTIDTDIIGERIDKANAKLISAAPDLLEALKELVELKEWKNSAGKDESYLTMQPLAWGKAKDAINKAIG